MCFLYPIRGNGDDSSNNHEAEAHVLHGDSECRNGFHHLFLSVTKVLYLYGLKKSIEIFIKSSIMYEFL